MLLLSVDLLNIQVAELFGVSLTLLSFVFGINHNYFRFRFVRFPGYLPGLFSYELHRTCMYSRQTPVGNKQKNSKVTNPGNT